MSSKSSAELPDVSTLSTGAVSLLALAAGAYDDRTRQRRHDIVEAAVLRRCFDAARGLPRACREFLDDRSASLRNFLGEGPPPPNLFAMFVAINHRIWTSIVEKEKRDWDQKRRLTAFDHSAFIALATAFSEKLGMADGVGPTFARSVREIAELSPTERQKRLILHYLGNVMQDYFDAASIRRQNPRLPKNTELLLRTEDARVASDIVFADLGDPVDGVAWNRFVDSFKAFFGAVALLESEQHGDRQG